MFHRGQQMSERKRSPLPPPRGKLKNQQVVVTAGGGSDSDAQSVADSNSLSGESGVVENLVATTTTTTMTSSAASRKKAANNRRRGSEWEILEGLKDGQRFESKPDKYSGYLHKKRKWPLKGWHKRYFVVDKGLLVYAKNPTDIARGKLHGSVDIGLSVISTKEKRRRVDIDADEFIYHLKAKTAETFSAWVQQLRAHRLYRQHLLTYGTRDLPLIRSQGAIALLDDIDSPTSGRSKIPLTPPEVLSRDSSLPRGMKPIAGGGVVSPGGRLAAWIVDSTPALESVNKELGLIQQNVAQLTRMLEHIETLSTSNSTAGDAEMNPDGSSPNVKKDRKKFGLRKKKSSKGSSVDLTTSMNASVNPENASPLSTCSFSSLSAVPNATLSASNSSLSTVINSSSSAAAAMMITAPFGASRPHSLPGTDHLQAPCSIISSGNSSGGGSCTSDRQFLSGTPDNQLRDDFTILAKDVVSGIKGVLFTMLHERDRLKAAVDGETATTGTPGSAPGGTSVAGVRAALTHALQQNAELRGRLAKVHEASDLSEISSAGPASEIVGRHFATSLSYSSSCVSASEFYDAEDAQGPTIVACGDYPDSSFKSTEAARADGESDEPCDGGVDAQHGGGGDATDTSSEAGSLTSEEGSVSSENSEIGTEYNAESSLAETGASGAQWTGRRTKLPVPRPDTEGFSLWNLLCKNIGKDLSQISMPVALNEPLNMLQRLCEELEYSELLDKASELDDPFERMVYVAAFAVSSYASSYYRAGNKPFNPLLGETYECVRDDRGFRFVSEQVSHHPPVSACHADGRSFVFWQDARIKTKFWGKSMEFQPIGTVNVHLLKHGAHYAWNKVTTCVHDLFGQRRSVDRYGELVIRDLNDADISCRLTFIKASRWSASRHEVRGVITGPDGKILKRLFGRWSEALYCSDDGSSKVPCSRLVWRPGAMPADHELYYGFTQFAIELNELGPEVPYLPPTDSRFRPDQRALERGDLDAAERLKLQVEQGQRDRRKRNDVDGINFEPKWFSKRINSSGEEVWDFNGKYWETRKSPGFANIAFETLW